MSEPSVVHNTFVVERSYPQSPARVFQAFADPAQKQRWFANSGPAHTTEFYSLDFRVGGQERARYTFPPGTPIAGKVIENEIVFFDIQRDRRIVFAQRMTLDGPAMSAATITIELVPNGAGTDLVCTHQAAFFENADGPAMREGGWRALFDNLAKELDA